MSHKGDAMAGLTAPRESKILGPDGKPFVTQVPVTYDHEATLTTTVWMLPKLKPGETYEDWARRWGRVDNVGTP
jgi:hypothetical protein